MAPKTLRLLLVDDEEPNRRALARRLLSHEVFIAESYDEAGDVLRRKTVDVVISDNGMPERSGLEVLQLAARLQPATQRIMFSGTPPLNLHRHLDRGTIHHFFAKPGDQDLLELLGTLAGAPLDAQPAADAEAETDTRLRSSKRFATNGPVEIRCESWGQFVKSYTKDISHGGLFIQTATPPPINTELEVKILLPDGHSFELSARVVHLITPEKAAVEEKKPGIGVQFLDLDERRRRHIRALVEIARLDFEQGARSGQSAGVAAAAAPAAPERREPRGQATERSAEQEEVIRRLGAELLAIKEKDELAVLGLKSRDSGEARRAYHKLSKAYHPDRFGKYGDPEIDRLATEIFILIKRAFTRLRQTRKVNTVRRPSSPPKDEEPPYGQTITTFPGPPPDGSPIEAPSLNNALQRIARKQYPEAERELERILARDTNNKGARIWLNMIQARQLKANGEESEALAKYRTVLELDERNHEAAREVRAISEAQRARRSFGGLFGKEGD